MRARGHGSAGGDDRRGATLPRLPWPYRRGESEEMARSMRHNVGTQHACRKRVTEVYDGALHSKLQAAFAFCSHRSKLDSENDTTLHIRSEIIFLFQINQAFLISLSLDVSLESAPTGITPETSTGFQHATVEDTQVSNGVVCF